MDKPKRITVDLPPAVFEKLRVVAFEERVSIAETVRRAVEIRLMLDPDRAAKALARAREAAEPEAEVTASTEMRGLPTPKRQAEPKPEPTEPELPELPPCDLGPLRRGVRKCRTHHGGEAEHGADRCDKAPS